MNDFIKNIISRASVKKYKPDAVPGEYIDEIVDAGLWAPSGMNRQSPIIVAVTDKETRDRLSAANAAVMGMNGDPFYGAPVVLVVLADKSCPTHVYDGSLAMENMLLAAHSLGLGGCWIHRAKEVFDKPKWKKWLSDIGVKGDYEGIGNCIVGYPDGEPKPRSTRNDGRVFKV